MRFEIDLIVRIVVGTLLGGVIGYERDLHGRPAGLRTHAIVALASSTFMVVSTHFVYLQRYAAGDLVAVDPSRIAASVVSGIGFLAGGAILRTGLSVQGLTTAAGLWLVAAIGLAAGGGMYPEAVAATILGIAALTLLRRFEDKDDRETLRQRLVVSLADTAEDPTALAERLSSHVLGIGFVGLERDVVARTSRITFDVTLARTGGDRKLLTALQRETSMTSIVLGPRPT